MRSRKYCMMLRGALKSGLGFEECYIYVRCSIEERLFALIIISTPRGLSRGCGIGNINTHTRTYINEMSAH